MCQSSSTRVEVLTRSIKPSISCEVQCWTRAGKKLMLGKPLPINEGQAAIIPQLWGKELRQTPQIDLNQSPKPYSDDQISLTTTYDSHTAAYRLVRLFIVKRYKIIDKQ